MSLRATLLLLAGLALPACGEDVNLDEVPTATAGCDEKPTEELLRAQAIMLPGRHCIACHREGGQAHRFPWTAAGTVFAKADSKCNTGGVGGVEVKLMDEAGKELLTLTTNRTGNFYTREPLTYKQLRLQIKKDGKTREMALRQTSADCPTCHLPGGFAGARIYLE